MRAERTLVAHRAVALLLAALPSGASAQATQEGAFAGDVPAYVEEAAEAGIVHSYSGPWEYFVGGGVATLDCNQDRMPDAFIAGGAGRAALFVNRSATGGALRFEQRSSTTTDLTGVTGAYALDLDNDGYRDLVVLRVGENKLLRGGPDCQFTPANASLGFDGGRAWTTAFSATFDAGATFPTLAFGNYVDRTAPGSPWGTCSDNVLVRPADANETLRYTPSLPLSPGYCALSMLFTDWNRSGVDALRVTNDRQYHRGGQEQLWRFDRGRYPRPYTLADGWQPLIIWGMGIAEGDLNADGFPEYVLTSMGDTKLQSLDLVQATEENRPVYEDIAYDRGATAHRPYIGDGLKPSTGWHSGIADFNNDARADIYISKGNVERMDDFASFDPDNLLLGTASGRFSEQGDTSGIALDRRGRGAAIVDFNADGQLDLLVVNRGANVSLFRHHGARVPGTPRTRAGGNWLQIELSQAGANRDAVGARLSIKTGNLLQTRRVQVGGGHASGSAGFVHVGLGVAERATVRVQWPDGEWSAPYRLFANSFALIRRGERHIDYWFPAAAD